MTRKITYKIAASALSLVVLAASASDAFAGWRWHGSSGGSSGGYGSSGGGSSGGWGGGSSGGWGGGSSGGWGGSSGGGGWKHHKRWFRGHGSSGGGWGSSGGGSSGGHGGGWGSSGGGSSGGGSSGGSYYYAPSEYEGKAIDPSTAPVDPMTPSNPPPAPGTPQDTSYRRADGLLAVNVPEDAKVFVNGLATSSTGAERQYVSRDLQSGFNYTYEVRAEVVRDGKTVEQVKQVNLRAGQTADLAFDFPAVERAETSLTVHVPADAKVYLAGNPTNAKGQTRIFRTTGLSNGKAWNDYTVRVEFEQDGRVVSQEKTISLAAGQSQELTFDFPAEKVASR